MNRLSLYALSACVATASAAAQVPASDRPVPADARVRFAGILDVATQTLSTASSRSFSAPVYVNDSPSGFFYDTIDGRRIIDEGRLPGRTSTDILGTQDSYTITSLQIGYSTNATDPSLGGAGMTVEVSLYESFATCGTLGATDAPVATYVVSGLPGSLTGSSQSVLVNLDLSAMPACLRADGGDGYSDGDSDRFGWSFRIVDPADATAAGPLLAGDPANSLEGDGTFFSGNIATGTGLDTADLFAQMGAGGMESCLFFGGYPANPFSSFYLVASSDLAGDCIGCGVGDDRFEENDDLASAAAIGLDTYGGLISDAEDDWFVYTIPADTSATFVIDFVDATSDLDLFVFDGAGTELDSSTGVIDQESVIVFNCGSSMPMDVYVQVLNFSSICNEYDLSVTEGLVPGDDILEDNDSCLTAGPLPIGITRDLVVRPFCGSEGGEDSDWYAYTLAAGDSLTVDILFEDAIADIDLVIYDVSAGCPGVSVSTGFSTTDNEHAAFTNATAGPLDVVVRVDHFAGGVNTYDLSAKVGPATIGELLCFGEPNSVTPGARVCTTGSDIATDNHLVFDVTDLPLMSTGFFIVSQDTIVIVQPGGSEGTLCIGSPEIGRFSSTPQNSGAIGMVTFSPDITSIELSNATGTVFVTAISGDTFNWQYWYRDTNGMGVPTSNFSDAVTLTFQ
ncbi:hypothetical protein Poly30_50550 [Planctomycetes bacterium Poly30]|uniref:Uncharacterized protein n=1 Tax=Saltatorellus ferox TaxID=2528018 RepID=A0A518EZI1_9BACT|nr:hypothetical protein Poly30_50550 [Planctomycetes bacterium Poly30]